MRSAINKLERRVGELKAFDVSAITSGSDPSVLAMQASIRQTLESCFGTGTTQFRLYEKACDLDDTTYRMNFYDSPGTSNQEIREGVNDGIKRAIALLEQAVRSLKEDLGDMGADESGRALRAYEGLDLHSEIERAAGDLYRNGHYANAIEDAVKGLNALVRLRSGRENLDGTALMEAVFSPKAPVLKFNALADESDLNEQRGFMMMFSGAVAGLRNPRAHKLIQDDAERALEFIAFVSLLAKLLDSAKK
jgi:uncharacterized protein (TIGR02391 family)